MTSIGNERNTAPIERTRYCRAVDRRDLANAAAMLEHVPPELNWQDSHGVLDRRFYRH